MYYSSEQPAESRHRSGLEPAIQFPQYALTAPGKPPSQAAMAQPLATRDTLIITDGGIDTSHDTALFSLAGLFEIVW
jgi:hypothetical protein